MLIPGNAADMVKNKADVYRACLHRAQSLVGESIAFAYFTPLYSELKKWDLPLVRLLLVSPWHMLVLTDECDAPVLRGEFRSFSGFHHHSDTYFILQDYLMCTL